MSLPPSPVHSFLLAALASLVLASPAGATLTATPLTPTADAVAFNQPIAVNINTDVAAVVDLGQNQNWVTETSDGSPCSLVQIRRGTQRRRCTLPAGGSVWYHGLPVGGGITFASIWTGVSLTASYSWTTTANPTPPSYPFGSSLCGRPWMSFYINQGC